MSRLLSSFQHDVKCASSIQSALALAQEHSFDLVISDIGLPDGSGEAMMAQLQEQHSLPGIAITGFPEEPSAPPSNFVARLVKPITLERLQWAINSAVDGHGNGQDGDGRSSGR
jgi:DNA-binding NtrC family response regulator